MREPRHVLDRPAPGDVRLVLVAPSHPGNVGAAARAIMNMGLGTLHLVDPARPPYTEEAMLRSAGGLAVLDDALVHDELAPAVDDCVLVCGLSARSRRVDLPVLPPRDAAPLLLEHARRGPVAVLFGREASGLTNDELARCRYRIEIPSNPDYPSLNLAMAVQVLVYELRLAAAVPDPRSVDPARDAWDQPPATAAEVEHLLAHLDRTLARIGFVDPANPGQVPARLRRLFQRLTLDRTEVGMLRGILTAAETAAARVEAHGEPARDDAP